MTNVLDEWVNRSGLVIDAMAHFDLGDGVKLDHSLESLRAVAAAVHEHYAGPAEVLDPDEQPLMEGVVAYVGEVLLVLARGTWAWDDASGFAERNHPGVADPDLMTRLTEHRWRFEDVVTGGIPVLHPNPALGLEPVSPLHLLLAEVGDGPGAIVATVERWQAAVTAHADAHPEWLAITDPVLTDGMPIMPPSPVLDEWLADRREAFPRWARAQGGTWDFTPGSVDDLGALVHRVTPSVEDWFDPANADFVEGASWYFGEMLCQVNGRWMFHAHVLDPDRPRARAFVVQTNDNADYTTPFTRIWGTLESRDPAELRAGYDEWVENNAGNG